GAQGLEARPDGVRGVVLAAEDEGGRPAGSGAAVGGGAAGAQAGGEGGGGQGLAPGGVALQGGQRPPGQGAPAQPGHGTRDYFAERTDDQRRVVGRWCGHGGECRGQGERVPFRIPVIPYFCPVWGGQFLRVARPACFRRRLGRGVPV